MEGKGVPSVPYIVHEGTMARMERTVKRLWLLVILLIVLLFGSNLAWIWYEAQFEDVVTTVEANTDTGGTAVANSDGSVMYYGQGENHNQETRP